MTKRKKPTQKLRGRARHALHILGMQKLSDVANLTQAQIIRTKGIGRKSLRDLREALAEEGLEFARSETVDWPAGDRVYRPQPPRWQTKLERLPDDIADALFRHVDKKSAPLAFGDWWIESQEDNSSGDNSAGCDLLFFGRPIIQCHVWCPGDFDEDGQPARFYWSVRAGEFVDDGNCGNSLGFGRCQSLEDGCDAAIEFANDIITRVVSVVLSLISSDSVRGLDIAAAKASGRDAVSALKLQPWLSAP